MTDTPPRPSRRLTHRLSAVFVRTAPPGFYCDGHGLNLRVDPSGARRWVQRLVIRGRPRMPGLGGYPLVSLAEARDVAFAHRKQARAVGDPLTEKRHAQHVPTVEEAAAPALVGEHEQMVAVSQRPRRVEDLQGAAAQGHPVVALHLHACGRDGPHAPGRVDLGPHRPAHLAPPRRREHQELERQRADRHGGRRLVFRAGRIFT